MFNHVYNIAIETEHYRTVYSANCPAGCDSDISTLSSIPAQMTGICTDQCTYKETCEKLFTCIQQYIEIDYYCQGNCNV